ncbi:hypothetical protein COCMIDRAFT_90787 [Bipolaris oryzae ATCC 44560]|uniref:Uncharacterized protein n=1 Tax=Bipolaris oryzae ATCC 44560 TaxID=930090 RepID=W6ZBM6_COCMI|nr:uncharacterized protein COCMIDRAFT_90787 [Bipolaris oryzae ATCC 44560]EUC47198.1 hypothetical protein COCMIDRAFT_90787 [Bipolaris oryzae ATCC 44560]
MYDVCRIEAVLILQTQSFQIIIFQSSLYILDGCQDLTSHHIGRMVDISENGDKLRSLRIGQLSPASSMVHPGQTL